MRKNMSMVKIIVALFAMIMTVSVLAQQPTIQNYRPNDQTGINQFEPAKDLDTEFEGFKIRIGGSFTQQYQGLSHSNDTTYSGSGAELYNLGNGFNTATANLNLDMQLADGIRVSIENYMSSRHHVEFWVKGGYIQVDKLPMFDNTSWYDKYLRVKIGHFQPNFGDQQFRRTDNGNAIYNPFVGNYIMDAFTTEIGGEIYVFPAEGFVGMIGLTSGLIKGDIKNYENGKEKQPSIYLKLAYDKAFENDLRVRLSASFMANSNSGRNTLYGGDRTGSRYYLVMEGADASTSGNAFSGRWNPGFSNKIMSYQINPFVKFKGIEFFGVYERASGNNLTLIPDKGEYQFMGENERAVTQLGGEILYRFLKREQLYVGAKYNQIKGELNQGYKNNDGSFIESSIDRIGFVAGWYTTKNLLLKVEYVEQNYKDFPNTERYYEGKFSGVVVEAVVAF